MSKILEDWELQAVLAEYNMLREEIRMFIQFYRRDTHLLILVLGAMFAACLAKESKLGIETFHIIAPSAIFIYYLFQIINIHMLSIQSQQCSRIERQMNHAAGRVLMDWESTASPYFRKKPHTPCSFAVIMLLLSGLTLFIFLALQAYNTYGMWSLILHGSEFSIMAFATVVWTWYEWKNCMLRDLPSRK